MFQRIWQPQRRKIIVLQYYDVNIGWNQWNETLVRHDLRLHETNFTARKKQQKTVYVTQTINTFYMAYKCGKLAFEAGITSCLMTIL